MITTKTENLNLISLPSLGTENILDHLTSPELQRLRATCTTMQSYVQNPKYLKRITVLIRTKEQLKEIRESQVPLYSVFLSSRVPYSSILKQNFKSTIVELQLQKPLSPMDLVYILNKLTKLESLDFLIGRSDRFDEELEDYQSLYFYKNQKYERLMKIKIESVCCETVRNTFQVFFKRCPNLISIELPKLSNSPEYFRTSPTNLILAGKAAATNYCDEKCASLIKFIQLRTQFEERTKQFTIDFGKVGSSNVTRWDVDCDFNFSAFPLTPKELMQLAKHAKHLKLLNVPSHALPKSIELTQEDKANLNICIHSIVDLYLRTNESLLGLYCPPDAKITAGFYDSECGRPPYSWLHQYSWMYEEINF